MKPSSSIRHPILVFITLIAFVGVSCIAGKMPGATRGEVRSRAVSVPLRVMSFNVRQSAVDDGENAWSRRRETFFKAIVDFSPDLVGFQEVLADQYDAMIERLPEYAFSGRARIDGRRQGEWALIGYRKDRFTMIKQGDFWLSETPSVPGSKSWDAAYPRICSWVRLRETATGREMVFANTHFDHKGVVARLEAAKLLSRELSRIADGVPAILTGDLNVTEDDPPYEVLVGSHAPGLIGWIDAYREMHPDRSPDERSFHGFQGGIAGARIDFIFHNARYVAVEATIDRACAPDGRFPSDHYAVTAVLRYDK